MATLGTRILITLGCMLLVCSFAPTVGAQSQADPADDVATLIWQLDAPRFSAREQASRRLTALGTDALAPIIEAQTHHSLEVRMRAQSIERAIVLPPLKEASRVQYSGTSSVSELLQAIEIQTGNYTIVGDSLDDVVRQWRINNLSYWEALLTICAVSDNSLFAEDNPQGWELRRGTHRAEWFATSKIGLVKRKSTFEIWDLQIIRLLQQLNPPNQRWFHVRCAVGLHFHVFFEPKAVVAEVLDQGIVYQGRTQEGETLRGVVNREPKLLSLLNGARPSATILCSIASPSSDDARLETLSFSLPYSAYGSGEEVRFAEEGEVQQVHNCTMRLDEIVHTEEHTSYQLTVYSSKPQSGGQQYVGPQYVETLSSMHGVQFADTVRNDDGTLSVKVLVQHEQQSEPQTLRLRMHRLRYTSALRFDLPAADISLP